MNTSFRFVAIAFLICAIGISCNTSTDPPVVEQPCQDICDTLDFESPDSSVVLSIEAIGQEYMVLGVTEYAVGPNDYTVVYRIRDSNAIMTLPISADYHQNRVLFQDAWGIKEADLATGVITPIVQGYIQPTYSIDSNHIILRRFTESFTYNRSTGETIKILDNRNIREYKPGYYVYYDRGFYLYDEKTALSERIEPYGFPVYFGGVQFPDWDLDPLNGILVVHIRTVEWDYQDNRLYTVDIAKRTAHRILGHTDRSYTPRFSSESELYVVRTCQTSRESYVIKVDPETGCERVVVTAWMNADGRTEWFRGKR